MSMQYLKWFEDRPLGSAKSITSLVCFGLAIVFIHGYLRTRYLPPGPRRYPLLGNLLQFPLTLPWLRFTEWSEEFGPIISLDLLGQTVIVLNTHRVAKDLLERRSDIFSDRPRLIMAAEIYTANLFMAVMRYSQTWRRHRRAAREGFSLKASEKFRPIQVRYAIEETSGLLDNPRDWRHRLERFAGLSIFRSVYGRQPPATLMMPFIERIRDLAEGLTTASQPGAFLVELLPVMLHLPDWLAPWKREGKARHRRYATMLEDLSKSAAARSGESLETERCFVAQLVENDACSGLPKKDIAWLADTMSTGGSETIATSLEWFFLSMVFYAHVMHKAQAELDAVIGRDRPPAFEDMRNLPYVCAIVKEVLRWRPVAPAGLPHCTTADAWYQGYLIPKGAIVLANVWAMNRDPMFYPDFDDFRPERFLEESGPAAAVLPYTRGRGHVTYGFGRQICVGMYFADHALHIMIATILWAADITRGDDAGGQAASLPPLDVVDRGAVVGPSPFTPQIMPRFPEAQAVLAATISEM